MHLRIQAKAEMVLTHEAKFYGVEPAAVAKAVIDRVIQGGMIRDVLQGVDVESYGKRGRRRVAAKQKRQKQQRIFVEFGGRRLTLSELSDQCGIPAGVLYMRIIRRDWAMDRAVTTPFKSRHR